MEKKELWLKRLFGMLGAFILLAAGWWGWAAWYWALPDTIQGQGPTGMHILLTISGIALVVLSGLWFLILLALLAEFMGLE